MRRLLHAWISSGAAYPLSCAVIAGRRSSATGSRTGACAASKRPCAGVLRSLVGRARNVALVSAMLSVSFDWLSAFGGLQRLVPEALKSAVSACMSTQVLLPARCPFL